MEYSGAGEKKPWYFEGTMLKLFEHNVVRKKLGYSHLFHTICTQTHLIIVNVSLYPRLFAVFQGVKQEWQSPFFASCIYTGLTNTYMY